MLKSVIMISKKIDFGTVYDVTVIKASERVLFVNAKLINEGFIIIDHGLKVLPDLDSDGKIVFVKGGPAGGYWKFYTVDDYEKEMNEGIILTLNAYSKILKHLAEGGSKKGIVECDCGGKLHYCQSSNNHIWAKCSTCEISFVR